MLVRSLGKRWDEGGIDLEQSVPENFERPTQQTIIKCIRDDEKAGPPFPRLLPHVPPPPSTFIALELSSLTFSQSQTLTPSLPVSLLYWDYLIASSWPQLLQILRVKECSLTSHSFSFPSFLSPLLRIQAPFSLSVPVHRFPLCLTSIIFSRNPTTLDPAKLCRSLHKRFLEWYSSRCGALSLSRFCLSWCSGGLYWTPDLSFPRCGLIFPRSVRFSFWVLDLWLEDFESTVAWSKFLSQTAQSVLVYTASLAVIWKF